MRLFSKWTTLALVGLLLTGCEELLSSHGKDGGSVDPCNSAAGPAPTAQAAFQQGLALAAHIAGVLDGIAVPVRPVKHMGTLVSLGHVSGAGEVAGLQLSGYLPAMLKRANVARWLLTAAGPGAAARFLLGLKPATRTAAAPAPHA
jgi:hypothetical protein